MSSDQQDLLARIGKCVQTGKANAAQNIPRGSAGQPGVTELCTEALAHGLSARTVLEQGLLAGMQVIGKKFAANEVFIPEVLISARAMHAGLAVLKPHFAEAESTPKGVFVIGTVRGDLHDIGKNLVAIIFEGAGWKVVDLGTDCPPEKFVAAVRQHPGCVVGMSALLTTTMVAMRDTVTAIRKECSDTIVLVGGAPVTAAFAREIGADGYADDPSGAVTLLDELIPKRKSA